MKQTLAGLTLGFAVIAGATAPASAADWNNGPGSIKDLGGTAAVPVPAPVPVPVYNANWYFRFDAGIGVGRGGPGFSEDGGMQYGHMDSPGATGPEPFGMNSSWFSDDYPTFATYGAGVGYIWSPRFRTDVTVEGRTQGRNVIDGEASYIMHAYDAGGNWAPIVDGLGNPMTQVTVHTTDSTRIQGGLAMVNLYYDFDKFRGFTPYVGVGLGVSFNELSRSHTTRETACDLTTTPACNTHVLLAQYSASDRQHTMTLAAMLTAGFSYQVSEITALDFNYRFLHLEGTSANLAITNGDWPTPRTMTSRVSIGDTQEHQLRAGLRFNIH